MGNLPLHPMLVHAPLVLAVAAPIVIGAVWWLTRGRSGGARAWWVVTAVAAGLAASSIVAVRTGEAEEEFIEEVVREAAIEPHEEAAELFMWSTLGLLALALAVPLVKAPGWSAGVRVATLAAAVAVAGMAFSVGHSGGALVYQHGAAAAYVGTGSTLAGEALPTRIREREHARGDDDDDDERD